MRNRHYGRAVMSSLEGIDPELLYDAGAYHAPKLKKVAKPLVAAAVLVIAAIGAILLVSANTVRSYLTLDSDYGVTLRLNSSGRVLSAVASNAHYAAQARECKSSTVEEAARILIDGMQERGGLDSGHNTLLCGITEDSGDAYERLIGEIDTDDYCMITTTVDEDQSIKKLAEKYRITMGKATYIAALHAADERLSEKLLYRLNMNDLAVLAAEWDIEADGVTVRGTPATSGYLSADQAREIALQHLGKTADSAKISLDTDGWELQYRVLLYCGDRGAGYFISADSGRVTLSFDSTAADLQETAERVTEEIHRAAEDAPDPTSEAETIPTAEPTVPPLTNPAPTQPTASEQPAEPTLPTDAPTQPTDRPTDPTDPTVSPTQRPTEPTDPPTEPTQAPTAPPATAAPPDRSDYLSTEQWSGNALPDIVVEVPGTLICEDLRNYSAYQVHNPNAVLLFTEEQQQKCRVEHPEIVLMKEQIFDQYDDSYFSRKALLLVRATERFRNTRTNSFYLVKSGRTLYIAIYDSADDIPEGTYEKHSTPQTATYGIELNAGDVADVTSIRCIRLSREMFLKIHGYNMI